MARLKPEDFTRIRTVVEAAEKKTVGEIVPLVLKHAADYSWVHSVMAFHGLIFGIVAGLGWEYTHAWPVTAQELRLLTLSCGALGLLLSFIPAVTRIVVGKARLDREAHSRAFAEFVHQGCAETHERTGILVLLCLFERRIVIIADSGVQTKVIAAEGAGIWDSLCRDFATFAKQRKEIEGLGTVIERIGNLLAKYFPGDGTHSNELSNDLRTED